MLRAVAIVALAGCGRVGFDAHAVADSAVDSEQLPFCAQHAAAVFCEDFDGPTSHFNDDVQGSGTLVIDSEALSPPSAVRTITPTLAASDIVDTSAGVRNLGTFTHVVASCAIYFDVIGSQDAVVFSISMDDGSELHALELVNRGAMTPYIEDSTQPNGGNQVYDYYQAPSLLASGMWHDVTIDYTAGASAHLTVTFDGAAVIDRVPTYTTTGQLMVRAGLIYISGPSTPWTVHVDNVVVDAS